MSDQALRRTQELTIIAQDPSVRIDGKILTATVSIPAEELAPGPVRLVRHPITGHAGDVLHHCLAPAENPVHQGRLAHVGPPDHGERRHEDVLDVLSLGLLPEVPIGLGGPDAVGGKVVAH